MAPPIVNCARELASAGYRVFPLVPNAKEPLIRGWPSLATTDDAQITTWWSDRPDCNVGIATGHGLVVLDCDTKAPSKKWPDGRSGLRSLALLDALDLPTSMRVETPSGGIHVYLKTNSQRFNSVDALKGFPGIDIRGDGGFVVGPGSMIDGREYRIV